MIIGLTGKNASGKGEAAEFLKSRGFFYHSLSDVVREALRQSGKRLTRENLIAEGRRLRQQYGPDILAQRVLEKMEPDKHYVVDSIRSPREVEAFRRRTNFYLMAVRAPARLRFERAKKRGRENDPKTFVEFVKVEKRELKGDETSQQLTAAEKMADAAVDNDGDLGEFHQRIRDILRKLSKKNVRPDWDDYFMGIAQVAALRSSCIKRKVAAVIVRDRRIVSTGYNGTPRGVRNCNEDGCPRCNNLERSGVGLEECLCCHAEENALMQAAYHGVSVAGGTLYSTFSPCLFCTKMIINSGIEEVVYRQRYTIDQTSLRLLKEAGVGLRRLGSRKGDRG